MMKMINKIKKTNIIAVFFLQISLLFGFQNAQAQDQNAETFTDQSSENQDVNLTVDKIDSSSFYKIAVIQALNKVTAKTSILELQVGGGIKFGKLTIQARKCWQASSEQRPDSKILLEVFDEASDGKQPIKNRIFYGWMISSSPSISGLEHPIYDITAIGCKR